MDETPLASRLWMCHPRSRGINERCGAELMRRAFGYELLVCPKCGGKMALLGCIFSPASSSGFLRALGLQR